MNAETKYIELLGERHAIILPSFADRDSLAEAYAATWRRGGVALLRAGSAAVGLCTRVGRRSGARFGPDYDALRYGGDVYSWLREQGVKAPEIATAAREVMSVLTDALSPRSAEVAEEVGFSAADAGA